MDVNVGTGQSNLPTWSRQNFLPSDDHDESPRSTESSHEGKAAVASTRTSTSVPAPVISKVAVEKYFVPKRIGSCSILQNFWEDVRFSKEDHELWRFQYTDLPRRLHSLVSILGASRTRKPGLHYAFSHVLKEMEQPYFHPGDGNVLIVLLSSHLPKQNDTLRQAEANLRMYQLMWRSLQARGHSFLQQIAPSACFHLLKALAFLPVALGPGILIEQVLRIMASHHGLSLKLFLESTRMKHCALAVLASRYKETEHSEHSKHVADDLSIFFNSLPGSFALRWILHSIPNFYDISLVYGIGYPAAANLLDMCLVALRLPLHYNKRYRNRIFKAISNTFKPADLPRYFSTVSWAETSRIIFTRWVAPEMTRAERHFEANAILTPQTSGSRGEVSSAAEGPPLVVKVMKLVKSEKGLCQVLKPMKEFAPLAEMIYALRAFRQLGEIYVDHVLDLLLRLEHYEGFERIAFLAYRSIAFKLSRSMSITSRCCNALVDKDPAIARSILRGAARDLSLYPGLMKVFIHCPNVDSRTIFGYLAADDYHRRSNPSRTETFGNNVLTGFQVRLLHEMASEFVSASHISGRARTRNIYRLFLLLRARSARIYRDLSNAMTTAALIDPILRGEYISQPQYELVLGVVREVEGEQAARTLDRLVLAHQEGPVRFANIRAQFWSRPNRMYDADECLKELGAIEPPWDFVMPKPIDIRINDSQ